MGCVCCSLSSFISILLHSLERITLCTVCAILTCCILFTILSVLVMGIGIGFHYCTVQNSVDAMAAAAKAAAAIDSRRSGGGKVGGGGESRKQEMLRSVGQAVKRGFAHRLGRRDRDMLMPSNNNTVNDRILRALNSSLNGTLPPHADEFVQRFAKPPRRPVTNSTDNMQVVTRSLNRTASILERGLNDTLALLKGNFMETPRRTRRDLTDSPHVNAHGNLTDAFNDTAVGTADYFTNISYFIIENEEMESNSTGEIINFNEALVEDSVPSNVSMQDVISRRQNCTLLNFFTMFF